MGRTMRSISVSVPFFLCRAALGSPERPQLETGVLTGAWTCTYISISCPFFCEYFTFIL